VRTIARNDDEIDPVRKKIRPEAETLAAQALDTVARDRISHLLRDDDTEARRLQLRRTRCRSRDEQDEVRRQRTLALRLDVQKLRAATNAPIATEPEACRQGYFL
jgi:hypothetical protein